MQLHAFDAFTPVEEVLSTLDSLVRPGRVRYVGVSNFAGWQIMKSLAVAERYGLPRYVGRSIPQVAIRWILTRPTVTSGILGARTEEQLLDNLGAVGWDLTADQLARLDAVSRVEHLYPHFPYQRRRARGAREAGVRAPATVSERSSRFRRRPCTGPPGSTTW